MRDFILWLHHWTITRYPGDYYAELRVIGEHGYRTQRFYLMPLQSDRLMADALQDDLAGLEVYIGVLPRVQKGGTTHDTTKYTDTLWFDLDAKHHGGDKRKALDAIIDFPIQPSVIVDSGHGFHAYIRLNEVKSFEGVQPIMKGIAQRIGGDHVYDRARILRLPGLSNHKDGGNAPVRLIRFDTTLSYRLSDLTEYEYREPDTTRQYLHTRTVGPYTFRLTDDVTHDAERIERELAYDPGKGARSGHDFHVACLMVESGWSDGKIHDAFGRYPQGVGAKTATEGARYLDRTIRKARQAVGR